MANAIYANMPTTVFSVMSGLAREHGAINLGQGFPDDPGPEAVRRAAAEAVLNGYNQYPPTTGLPELRQAVARHYGRTQGLDLDWGSEVTITSGATEAIACALLALIEPGDEVILFEPWYDAYAPMVRRGGGVAAIARVTPPDWRIDIAALERLVTPRTRLIVLNDPMNPGACLAAAEDMTALAALCVRHDLIAICDEVWEQVVFDGARHRSLMTYPGMRERCVKIGSAGKMFGLTGWKVGFLCAAPELTGVLARAHQFLTFTTPPNLQTAVAFGLDNPGDWFETMPATLQRSRDRLAAALRADGFAVLPSQGTYFLNVDLVASGVAEDDMAFCLRAVKEAGVAAIPLSAFYETDAPTNVVRLCFAKADATLDEGAKRLDRARALSIGG
jgi:aspartate/methionine/tyrosine aminotransferase